MTSTPISIDDLSEEFYAVTEWHVRSIIKELRQYTKRDAIWVNGGMDSPLTAFGANLIREELANEGWLAV